MCVLILYMLIESYQLYTEWSTSSSGRKFAFLRRSIICLGRESIILTYLPNEESSISVGDGRH
jgi:hypothetical protein